MVREQSEAQKPQAIWDQHEQDSCWWGFTLAKFYR